MQNKFLAFMIGFLLFVGIAGTAVAADVIMYTSLGSIEIDLYEVQAPESSANFLHYVDSGFYTDTVFHRVIPNFMIQGGGFTQDMVRKQTFKPIQNEAHNGLKNRRGTIAMARTNRIDSATSQFFINVADNDFLNHKNRSSSGYGYAVFGRVVKGMEIVDRIAAMATTIKNNMRDVPVEPVIIKSVVRI